MCSNIPCSHLDQITIFEPPTEIAGCEECLKTGSGWVHLRMCRSCGKIGCCDSLPNRHASRHAHEAAHPIAREYLSYGFTTLRDLGTMDPEFPTVDLRNALNSGLLAGPRLVVAAHIISSSAGHGDMRSFYAPRWTLPLSAIADGADEIRR